VNPHMMPEVESQKHRKESKKRSLPNLSPDLTSQTWMPPKEYSHRGPPDVHHVSLPTLYAAITQTMATYHHHQGRTSTRRPAPTPWPCATATLGTTVEDKDAPPGEHVTVNIFATAQTKLPPLPLHPRRRQPKSPPPVFQNYPS
jgi:hypothetical protein